MSLNELCLQSPTTLSFLYDFSTPLGMLLIVSQLPDVVHHAYLSGKINDIALTGSPLYPGLATPHQT